MSTIGRAAAPLPPGNVLFDSVAFPTSFANTSPITVSWNRRLRTKTSLSFQSDIDETPDITTNYFVRHGPAHSSRTEVDLGTSTSGTFNFDWQGVNLIEIYSKAGGKTSNILSFFSNVLTGTDTVGTAPIGTLAISPPSGNASVVFGGAIPALSIFPTQIPHPSGAIDGPLTLTAPNGAITIPASGNIGTLAILTPLGVIPVPAAATGSIPSVTITGPTGLEEVPAIASGGIGELDVSTPTGVLGISVIATGLLGTITVTEPDGLIEVPATPSGSIGTLTITGPNGVASGGTSITERVIPGVGNLRTTTGDVLVNDTHGGTLKT